MKLHNISITPDCGVEEQYRQALDQGVFVIQRCNECGSHIFFPRELCPHCGSDRIGWVHPSGRGTVYAATTVRRPADAGGDYNVSLIELDEKVRLMSRVEGVALDEIRIGLRVRARVALREAKGCVLFDALQGKGEE